MHFAKKSKYTEAPNYHMPETRINAKIDIKTTSTLLPSLTS